MPSNPGARGNADVYQTYKARESPDCKLTGLGRGIEMARSLAIYIPDAKVN